MNKALSLLNNYFVGKSYLDYKILTKQLDENLSGYGKLYIYDLINKYIYHGKIENGKMCGFGKIYYMNNHNQIVDDCIITYINNKSNYRLYEGDIVNNMFNGDGTLTYMNDYIYIGNFIDGKRNGQGKLYSSNGTLLMDNCWDNDIISGNIENIEYHNNTKNIKLIGTMCNGIKIGNWIHIRENLTISKIEYYKNYEINDVNKTELLELELTTNEAGYILEQKILMDDVNIMKLMDYEKNNEQLLFNKNTINELCDRIKVYALPSLSKGLEINKTYSWSIKSSSIYDECINEYENESCNNYIFLCKEGGYQLIQNYTGKIYVVKNTSSNSQIYIDKKLYYEGELNSSIQPEGNGTIYDNGILKYSGVFNKGAIVEGMLFTKNSMYSGTFKNYVPDGKGIFFENQIKVYEGDIVNNYKTGHGISYYENSLVHWDGQWLNDLKHGKGRLYDSNGDLICTCTFYNNEMQDIV